MNFFRVKTLISLGARAFPVEIECVQSRRLPYLQIIGVPPSAAHEQRERVMAAISSMGMRLPARRITVRYLPAMNESAEDMDLPVALAILGGMEAFPRERLADGMVIGALGLDGTVRAGKPGAGYGDWLRQESVPVVIVPAAFDRMLDDCARGAAVSSLAEALAYLRGDGVKARAQSSSASLRHAPLPEHSPAPVALRALQVAAAGGFHTYLSDPTSEEPVLQALATLLPPPDADTREEALAHHQLLAQPLLAWPPVRRISWEQATRLFRFDPKSGLSGELSLAHGGILALRLPDAPSKLLGSLQESMESGSQRVYRAGRMHSVRADYLMVGLPARCGGCGEVRESCGCGSVRKLRMGAAWEQARPHFSWSLCWQAGAPVDWLHARAQVASARRHALLRQGKKNARLRSEDCGSLVVWSADALGLANAVVGSRRLHFRRLALTLRDLRGGEGEVTRQDALEARFFLEAGP